MKTIEVEKTSKETWTVSDWGEIDPDCVVLTTPGGGRDCIYHESDERLSDGFKRIPRSVKAAARAIVLANRELAEDETRNNYGDGHVTAIGKMSVSDGKLIITWPGQGFADFWSRFQLEPWRGKYPERLAFLDKHLSQQWQPVEGAPGWEVRKLDDRVFFSRHDYEDGAWEFTESAPFVDELKVATGSITVPEPVILACCKLLGVEREVADMWTTEVVPGFVRISRNGEWYASLDDEGMSIHPQDAPVGVPEKVQKEAAEKWREGQSLAENEVIGTGLAKGRIVQLRWHHGRWQATRRGEDNWHSAWNWCPDAVAWFRAHCPIDRFVTDDGRVLEFRMTDEGEAEAVGSDGYVEWVTLSNDYCSGRDVVVALYRFRDHERARWTFDWIGDVVRIHGRCHLDGLMHSWFFSGDWANTGGASQLQPWAQRKAEALWEEKRPKWRTEWYGERVSIMCGDRCVGWLGKSGETFHINDWPPHILAEARSKFRENYQLRKNEIWFQGMPVEMEFVPPTNGDNECVKAGSLSCGLDNSRDAWGTACGFESETERLDAFDRMRAYYYDQHPGKCLHDGKGPLTFEMVGSIGHAKFRTSTVWTSDYPNSRDYPEWEYLGRKKLRRWTEAQLAKRPVTFEGKVEKFTADNDLKRVERMGHLAGFSTGPNKYVELVFDDGTELRLRGEKLKLPHLGNERRIRVTLEPIQ